MGLKDTEVCTKKDCFEPYYAKWLCKRHYKQKLGREGAYKREYAVRKNLPGYKQMKAKFDKVYKDKLRSAGLLSKKQQQYYKTWISKRKNQNKKKERQKIDLDNQSFGGAIERKC